MTHFAVLIQVRDKEVRTEALESTHSLSELPHTGWAQAEVVIRVLRARRREGRELLLLENFPPDQRIRLNGSRGTAVEHPQTIFHRFPRQTRKL